MSKKIAYALFITFSIFSFISPALATMSYTNNYTVTVSWGDGSSETNTYSVNNTQTDPLAYIGNYSSEAATASAAAGMWGNEENYSYNFWPTDGTGVWQNDPGHTLNTTIMTIEFDNTFTDPDSGDGVGYYSPWYDLNYLTGTVGGGDSFVSFDNVLNLGVISTSGTETFENSSSWSYYNNTEGEFYIDSGTILPDPIDYTKYFLDGEALHFYGTYTFMVDNDGGPSSISFTPDAPAPVPEPSTMLLFGIGFAGLVGSKLRRKRK